MRLFDVAEKRPSINIVKLGGAYYFKHFFNDFGLSRELETFYEKARYRFWMATAGERNKVMKILDKKGYDTTLIGYLELFKDDKSAGIRNTAN